MNKRLFYYVLLFFSSSTSTTLSMEFTKFIKDLPSLFSLDDTCLHFAQTREEVIHGLGKGDQIEALNGRDLTPLACAALTDCPAACTALLDYGAQINARNRDGLTALMFAAMRGNKSMCQLLIEHNAEVNAQSTIGATALILTNDTQVCQLLLASKAHLDPKMNDGSPILSMLATRCCYKSKIKTLITYPSLPNPSLAEEQFKISRQRIWAALCAFNRYCPTLPKDIRKLILCTDPELKGDLYNSAACGVYNDLKTEQIFDLPLPLVGLLIQNNVLPREKIIEIIKAHHFEYIKPLMLEALLAAPADEFRCMLNPARLEENFGTEIEQNIKIRLGLHSKPECTADSEKASTCSLQ